MPLAARGGESAHYTLDPVTVDHGGSRATSTHYTADFSGSPGDAGGAGAYTARSGFSGQLIDVTAIMIGSASPSLFVDEGGTFQLSAKLLFDDDTTTPLDANAIAWSLSSGPLSGIDAAGLATAGLVYQDSAAAVQGTYQSFLGSLDLTVVDSDPDNFGSYAGDGLEDGWQVQYFGLPPNIDAGPLEDPDGDGQDNDFEYTAGLVPTDGLSRFSLGIEEVPGQAGQRKLIFEPLVSGRIYTVTTSTDLGPGPWAPLIWGSFVDSGNQRTVTDPDASGPRKFYRVEIENP